MSDTVKIADKNLQLTNIKDNECVNRENTIVENKNVKNNKAEKYEIDTIGQFLLEEYRNMSFGIRTEWLVEKSVLRAKFAKFLQNAEVDVRQCILQANSNNDIGSLLHRTNNLINTKRNSRVYRIKTATFFEYVNKKLEEFDEKQKNGQSTEFMSNRDEYKISTNGDPELTGSLEVDENTPTHELLYEGGQRQLRDPTFQLTNMGCYICQKNFSSPNDLEEHVVSHGDESDFEILKLYEKNETPIFKLSYNICHKSHYFRFNLESFQPNIVIEKLVIVQTRTFYYVNNTRMPYALGVDGKDSFFVDSHLFHKGVVQPIVVVFRKESCDFIRNIEQHHFCRIEEFPLVHLNINPCRLPNHPKFKQKFKLPHYMPPAEIRRALQKEELAAPLAELSQKFSDYVSNKELTHHNIYDVYLKLLQIEDWEIIRNYSSLVQRNVQLRTYDRDYIMMLKLPKNIRSENIVSPFDDVIILPAEESNVLLTSVDDLIKKMEQFADETTENPLPRNKKSKHIGQVGCVTHGRVIFGCKEFIPVDKLYTIIFRPSRLVLRYQYRALEQMAAMPQHLLKQFLFPEEIISRELPAFGLDLLNKSIYGNPEQLQAIQCMVSNNVVKNVPFILFGPPGTGKTTTLVEAIYQIYMLQPQSRILITAGSNGACDEIALRLCNALAPHIERQTITRVYSRSCEGRAENINETLLEYSNLYGDHFLPDVEVLHSYRIVVCTLSLVGRLSTGRFGEGRDGSGVFTHHFIDEVAASTEAQALVGIMATLTPSSRLIIAGDHQQLGPILNSKRAADMGLKVSLMERLLARECYRVDEDGNYNRHIQARLRRNYRSHPEIVNLFSEMFYKGELIAEAKTDVQELCSDWHRAPNAEYPIIFHSVFGPEQREKNCTSRYNPLEIQIVMDYVRDLLCFGINGRKIEQSDIGIISPYKKQYLRIQEELNLRNWYQIETGAVESFQGKEKTVIIVSFVRSFTSDLGFLESRNRLNVALSRARSLLILIGNPRTLSINGDFKHIIELCQQHCTMVGATYHGDDGKRPNKSMDQSMRQLTITLEQLNVGGDVEAKNAKSKAYQNKQAYKNTFVATRTNERSPNGNDVLKSNNSNKFKTAQPTSAEKNRQTFELLKNLYHTEGFENLVEPSSSTAKGIKAHNKSKKSEIDELFEALPNVPCARKLQFESEEHDFEIVELNTELRSQHVEFQTGLNCLQRMSTTTKTPEATTITPKPTKITPKRTKTPEATTITPKPTTITPKPTTITPKPTTITPTARNNATISNSTVGNNTTNIIEIPFFKPIDAMHDRTIEMLRINVPIQNSSCGSNVTVFGRTEYPSIPRYAPNPLPKSQKSKSKCVIA